MNKQILMNVNVNLMIAQVEDVFFFLNRNGVFSMTLADLACCDQRCANTLVIRTLLI